MLTFNEASSKLKRLYGVRLEWESGKAIKGTRYEDSFRVWEDSTPYASVIFKAAVLVGPQGRKEEYATLDEAVNFVIQEFTSDPMRNLMVAVRELDRRLYHKHKEREPGRGGGCYSSSYQPCGEHHAHDMTCGAYPLSCWERESGPEVNAVHEALLALEKVNGGGSNQV